MTLGLTFITGHVVLAAATNVTDGAVRYVQDKFVILRLANGEHLPYNVPESGRPEFHPPRSKR